MRVSVGPVAAVSDAECVAIGDGRAVVVRVGDQLRAFENRCVHQESPIAGGLVRNGVLSCPLHFWRYHVDDGQLIGSRRSLQRFPVEVVDGQAYVLLPDPEPDVPLRQRLLARAESYDRDQAWRAERGGLAAVRRLGPDLEHEVERAVDGLPEAREAGPFGDRPQT